MTIFLKNYLKKEKAKTLKELAVNGAKNFSDDLAFIIKHKNNSKITYENITYTKFLNHINSFGTGLLKKGFTGNRVALIGPNSYEWMLTYFTVQSGIGILIPLDKGLPDSEIEYSLQKSKADVIVFSEEYLDRIMELKETTNLTKFICMQKNNKNIPTIQDFINIGTRELKKGNTLFSSLEIDPNELSLILFTSGTTSLAKAVMLTQRNILVSVNGVTEILDVTPKDVGIALLPFHLFLVFYLSYTLYMVLL